MARDQTVDDALAQTVVRAAEQTRDLIHREISAARTETLGKLRQSAPGTALLALGGVAGVFATAAVYRTLMRILDKGLPPVAAAAVGSGMFGGAAAAAIVTGTRSLREAPVPLPTETVATTLEAASESARIAAP